MSDYAKILSLSSTSAVATKTSALKTYFRSVRLIKDTNTLSPVNIPSYITNILLCGNCVDPENRNLYVFYIDTLIGAAWIIEINIDTRVQVVVYYDKYNVIGFNPLHKIYNARVVHGRIIWTDNLNPVYQMDIERAKNSFRLKIGYGQYPITEEWSAVKVGGYGMDQVVSNGNNFYKSRIFNNYGHEPKTDSFVLNVGTYWIRLCLIEDAYYSMDVKNFYFEPIPPKHPPVVVYKSDDNRKINNLRQTLFQIAYRYVYMDWRKSTFSPASIVPVPQAEEETATGLANELISLNNMLNIRVNSGGEEVRAIEIIGRSSQDPSKWFLIETVNKFEEQERGGEISVTSEPGYVSLVMTVMMPTVVNTDRPLAPTISAITNITSTSFRINITANSFPTEGFFVDIGDDDFSSFVVGFNNRDVLNVYVDVTGLPETFVGGQYYCRVRSHNAGGISENSIIVMAVLYGKTPSTPGTPTLQGNLFGTSFDAVTVGCAEDTGYLDYVWDLYNSSGTLLWDKVYPGSSGQKSINFSGLTTGQTYHVRVYGRHYDKGSYLYSNIPSAFLYITTPTPLPAPTALDATEITGTSFKMNFISLFSATHTYIDVSTSPSFSSFVWSYNNLPIEDPPRNYKIINMSILPGTTYYYRLRQTNTGGTSPSSNVKTVTTIS